MLTSDSDQAEEDESVKMRRANNIDDIRSRIPPRNPNLFPNVKNRKKYVKDVPAAAKPIVKQRLNLSKYKKNEEYEIVIKQQLTETEKLFFEYILGKVGKRFGMSREDLLEELGITL